MLNVILFGPPGAGKGTQASRIADRYQLKHISTGDILREEIRKESSLGKEAREFIDRGKLVPDEVLIDILKKLIEENRYVNGFVFDGYPRTLVQAEELDAMLLLEGLSISLVISLEVQEEELIARLTKRAGDQGRTDDQPGVIHQRLQTYWRQTAPLIEYFRSQNKLFTIKGVGTVDDVSKQLLLRIDKVNS